MTFYFQNLIICLMWLCVLLRSLFDLVTIWWLIWFGVFVEFICQKKIRQGIVWDEFARTLTESNFYYDNNIYIYIKSSLGHSYLYHLSHADHLSSLAHASVDKVRLLFGLQFCSYLLLLIAFVTNNYLAL